LFLLLIIFFAIVVNMRVDMKETQMEREYEEGYSISEEELFRISSDGFATWVGGLTSTTDFCPTSGCNNQAYECYKKSELGESSLGEVVMKRCEHKRIFGMSVQQDETIEVDLTGASGALSVSWEGAPAVSAMLVCRDNAPPAYDPLLLTIRHTCEELDTGSGVPPDEHCETVTFNVDIPAGPDRIMILGVTSRDNVLIQNATFSSGGTNYNLMSSSSGPSVYEPCVSDPTCKVDMVTEMLYLLDPPIGTGTVTLNMGQCNHGADWERAILVFGTVWKNFDRFNSFEIDHWEDSGEREVHSWGELIIPDKPSITIPSVTGRTILVDLIGFQSALEPIVGSDQNVAGRHVSGELGFSSHSGGMSWQSGYYGGEMTWANPSGMRPDFWTMVVGSFDLNEDLGSIYGSAGDYSNVRMVICQSGSGTCTMNGVPSANGFEEIATAKATGPFNLDVCGTGTPVLLRLRAIGAAATDISVVSDNSSLPPQMEEIRVQSFPEGIDNAEELSAPEVYTLTMINKRLPSLFDYVLFVSEGGVSK
jgi:hypothetical protein